MDVNIFTSEQTIYFRGRGWVCDQLFFGGEGGLRKCMVCTLMKILAFMDDP